MNNFDLCGFASSSTIHILAISKIDSVLDVTRINHKLKDYVNTWVQDVLNYEEFTTHLSSDEQQQLLKYLPPVDSFAPPDRFVCLLCCSVSPSCFGFMLNSNKKENSI